MKNFDFKKYITINKIFYKFVVLAFVALFFIATIFSFSYNSHDITVAEAVDVYDGSSFLNYLRQNQDINLRSNITISNPTVATNNAEYTGTVEGNGFTVTITGVTTVDTYKNTNVTTGIFASTLKGTIKNLKVIYSAEVNLVLKNDKKLNPGNNEVEATNNSYTLTAGILCGNVETTGKIENVDLRITSSGYFAVVGYDVSGAFVEKKKGLFDGNYKYNYYEYLGGAGGVAGGFAGKITSGTIAKCTLDNQGTIFARGSNLNAGEVVYWGELERNADIFTIKSSTHPCRASAGGIAGEIFATSGKTATSITSTHLKGNGYVVASLHSNKDGFQAHYNIAYSGAMIGQIVGATPNVTLDGVLYKSEVISSTSITSNNKAGTFLGEVSGTLTIKNVFRRNETNDASYKSGKAYTTYFNAYIGDRGEKAPKASTVAANLAGIVRTGTNTITYYASGGSSPTSMTNINNVTNAGNSYYNNNAGGGYGTIDFSGFDQSSGPSGGNILVAANATEQYYISALVYGLQGQVSYENIYASMLKSNTFNMDRNQQNPRIYYFKTDNKPLEMSFSGYSGLAPEKIYDRSGFTFQGSPQGTDYLASGLVWISKYKTLEGVRNAEYDTVGNNGSREVGTRYIAGIYDIAPHRIVQIGGEVEYQEVQNGESIGADKLNAPSTVYLYAKPNPMPKATITRKEVTIGNAHISFYKEYDGTPDVYGLLLGQHYLLNGLLSADAANTTITYDQEESKFVNVDNVPTSSVGENLNVRLVDCGVDNQNYTLSNDFLILNNCSIRKRVVQMVWTKLDGSILLGNEIYAFDYIKSAILPPLLVENPVGNDIVTVTTTTYLNSLTNTPIDAINAGQYNARPGQLQGADKDNYALPTQEQLEGYKKDFLINKLELHLDWGEIKSFSYNANEQNTSYTCNIKNKASSVLQGDSVEIQITYKNSLGEETDLRNVGIYSAFAQKVEEGGTDNYFIALGEDTTSGITIVPWEISLNYWTGNDEYVKPLVYNGMSYINSEAGLKVGIATSGTELGDGNFQFIYRRNGLLVGEVTTVGTYVATTSIVNGSQGNSLYFSMNYSISIATMTQEIEIIPIVISLIYGDLEFIYDGTSKKSAVSVNVDHTQVVQNDSVNTNKHWEDGKTVTNVGTYILNVTLNNASYEIRSQDKQRIVTITACDIANNLQYTITPLNDESYAFKEIKPNPLIHFKGDLLYKDTDYSLAYSNNFNAGEGTINITGKGNFYGYTSVNFAINKKPLTMTFTIPPVLIYDAKSKSSQIYANLSGVITGDTTPELIYDFQDTANTPTDPIKAGGYKVIARFDENNYKMPDPNSRTRTFNILVKELGIVFSGYESLQYTNSNLNFSCEFHPEKTFCPEDYDKISLQLSHMYGPINQQIPVEYVRAAGQYLTTVTLSGSAIDNYKITSSNIPGSNETNCNKLTFSVEKKGIKVEFFNSVVEFNNNSQKISFRALEGYSPLGDDTIANISNIFYEKDGETYTNGVKNAGIYSINITTSNINYKILETFPSTVFFTVNKKDIKLYLTYEGEALPEGKEFVYGGKGQNIGASISHAFRPNYGPITGDSVAVSVNMFHGDTYIPGGVASDVRDDYRVTLSLDKSVVNYKLDTSVTHPDEDSVLERSFKILKRPIKVIIMPVKIAVGLDNQGNTLFDEYYGDFEYKGKDSEALSAGLYEGDGYVDGFYSSGIVTGDTIAFLTYVYKYDSEDYDGNFIESFEYSEGEFTKIKDRGTYYLRAVIDNNPNYYIYTYENSPETKVVRIEPKEIKIDPKNLSKIYGDFDDEGMFALTAEGVGDDSDIGATLVREGGENAGKYSYTGIQYYGSVNYKVSLNELARDANGEPFVFTIQVREYKVNPKTFQVTWSPEEPVIDLEETIQIVTNKEGTISVTISYEGTWPLIPDAGIYDLNKNIIHMKTENNNVIITFAGVDGDSAKNKFIVLGRPVSIRVKDFEKDYGEIDPDFYSPENFVVAIEELPQIIQDEIQNTLAQGLDYDWSQLIRVTRESGENYMQEGYIVSYSFFGEAAKNYRPTFNDYDALEPVPKGVVKLFINKVEVKIESISLTVKTTKLYDGNNRVDNNLVKLTEESKNFLNENFPKLMKEGFKLSARFTSSNAEGDSEAGAQKKIYVSFSVYEEYSRNYILPYDYLYSNEGEIEKIQMPVTLEVTKANGQENLTYGESPTVKVRYQDSISTIEEGNENYVITIVYGEITETKDGLTKNIKISFVGNDNPTSLLLLNRVSLAYLDNSLVSINNIRSAGTQTIKIIGVELSNYELITNYVGYDRDDPTSYVDVEYEKKQLSVQATGKIFKKPVDNMLTANIDASYYLLQGVLNVDSTIVGINFRSALESILIGQTRVIIDEIELTGSSKDNYTLITERLYITAAILSLADVVLPVENERNYNGEVFIIKPTIEAYLSGATLKLNGATIEEGASGEGLEGAGTIVNIQVWYTGITNIYYPSSMTPPKDAGEYKVICRITNEAGYVKDNAAEATMIIKKVTPVINIDGRLKQEYGQFTPITAVAVAPLLSENLDVIYSFSNIDDQSIPEFPPAGIHTVTAVFEPNLEAYSNNYNRAEKLVEIRILSKQISVTITGYEDGFYYNGTNHLSNMTIALNGVVDGDNCIPVVTINGQNVLEMINAGSYFIDVSPSNNSYVIVGKSSIHLTINKAKLKVYARVEDTAAGTHPEYTIEYEGFFGDDSPDSLEFSPSVSLTGNQVGTNSALPKGGIDPNYDYEYIPTTYEIIYESSDPNGDANKYLVYYILLGTFGGFAVIVFMAVLGKKLMFRSVFRSSKLARKR